MCMSDSKSAQASRQKATGSAGKFGELAKNEAEALTLDAAPSPAPTFTGEVSAEQFEELIDALENRPEDVPALVPYVNRDEVKALVTQANSVGDRFGDNHLRREYAAAQLIHKQNDEELPALMVQTFPDWKPVEDKTIIEGDHGGWQTSTGCKADTPAEEVTKRIKEDIVVAQKAGLVRAGRVSVRRDKSMHQISVNVSGDGPTPTTVCDHMNDTENRIRLNQIVSQYQRSRMATGFNEGGGSNFFSEIHAD